MTTPDNVEQVFSREGQLSEVNLDPDALTDMVSIMVNKHVYKSSFKNVRTSTMRCSVGRIMQTKQTFSTVPRTRTQMRELDLEVGFSCYASMKLSVEVRTTQVSGYFINVECQ